MNLKQYKKYIVDVLKQDEDNALFCLYESRTQYVVSSKSVIDDEEDHKYKYKLKIVQKALSELQKDGFIEKIYDYPAVYYSLTEKGFELDATYTSYFSKLWKLFGK